MNFSVFDSALGRQQRCRQWTPLLTQQLRLRHVYQIMAYNLTSLRNEGSFYYTLHSTNMCAPFYTSKRCNSLNPKWAELESNIFPYPSARGFVLRVWQTTKDEMDELLFTWGINLSGLCYLGCKLSDIQPISFNENSVIFYLRGGYFTTHDCLRSDLPKPFPFSNYLNVMTVEGKSTIYRNSILKFPKSEVKCGYMLSKLQKLHMSQFTIKNLDADVEELREKINSKCGLCGENSKKKDLEVSVSETTHKNTSHLLTMTSLNRMLNVKTTSKHQKQKMIELSKSIEVARFRTKLLAQERDKMSVSIRKLKQSHGSLLEENEEKCSNLMENYHNLSREKEKVKEWRKEQVQYKELLHETNVQLNLRKKQLMSDLLFIYPIEKVSDVRYLINGVFLPDSKNLTNCTDAGLGVALGYVAHVVLMTAWFFQVPLRYPIKYFGSRSHIFDHVSPSLSEKDREFPLYPKGKDRMQFNYAVYLLNKNIAQLRWLCGINTPDLHATLPNLYQLLRVYENKEFLRSTSPSSSTKGTTNHASTSSGDVRPDSFFPWHDIKPRKKNDSVPTLAESRPGLNDILMIPEAFMNQQISNSTFQNYLQKDKTKNGEISDEKPEFDTENVEQGTDILNSSLNIAHDDSNRTNYFEEAVKIVEEHPKSVRLSITELTDGNLSEKFDNASSGNSLPETAVEDQQEFLQMWLESGPALVCSEQSLYPDEILGTTVTSEETTSPNSSHLTSRTDALLHTTSFNLIKPKE